MNTASKVWLCLMVSAAGGAQLGAAVAQDAPNSTPTAPSPAPRPQPKSSAQIDAGEPRADTTVATTAAPSTAAPRAATGGRRVAAVAGPKPADRVDLGIATVTGDREQPKVMYIVPWKKADVGDLSGKPINSLLDEALAPVDRDEFRREVAYYDAVKADPSQNSAPKAAVQGEK